MRIKKILSFAICVIMVITSFSACSSSKTQTDAKSQTNQTEDLTNTTDNTSDSSVDSSSNGLSSTSETSLDNKSTTISTKTKSSTSTTKKITPTTKKTTPTTKRTTTTTKKHDFIPPEVNPNTVKTVAGTIKRAWKLNSGSVSVEIHRVAYGSTIKQAFNKSNADSAIDNNKTVTYQPICNVAIVTCKPTNINIRTSKELLGSDTGAVNSMGQKSGALIAVNGSAKSLYTDGYPAIANNVVISKGTKSGTRMTTTGDGVWSFQSVSPDNVSSLKSGGVRNTYRYQDILLKDGKVTTAGDTYYHNRTVIAQISANKYILAVGEFMPLKSMANLLKAYGAKNAILLNGGNCSFMYVKGVGNVTGTKATQLKNLDKLNVIETEFFGTHGLLGLNGAGKQKLGGPCNEPDIVCVK